MIFFCSTQTTKEHFVLDSTNFFSAEQKKNDFKKSRIEKILIFSFFNQFLDAKKCSSTHEKIHFI